MSVSVTPLFEMSNLLPKKTGIGTVIWIQVQPSDNKKLSHDIRLKAMPNSNKLKDDDLCDIIFNRKGEIIEIKPNKKGEVVIGKNLRNLQKWILLNLDLLILHWDRKIGSPEFFRKYKKLD